MSYVALYRLWRPQDFDSLVGQEHISSTLKNAISTGKIAHAYLFAGPRGTGKTSMAKILAKSLNCADGPTVSPCGKCLSCERIAGGSSMDVFEIDAASNRGIDEIRDLREAVRYAPVEGRYKVYIIDEVHMLTTEAFNALLKTLEEPPAHIVFILATTEAHKIPATIHSRCQRYDFRRIPVKEIEQRLKEVSDKIGLAIAPEALHLIAVHADGGLRDALSILDQCAAMGAAEVDGKLVQGLLGLVGHEWVWRLTGAVAANRAPEVLVALDELVSLGKDVRQILIELALHFRSLMLYKAAPEASELELYSDDRKVLTEQSGKFSHAELVRIIQTLQAAANEAKWASEPRITAEMALLSACNRAGGTDQEMAALLERIAALEAAVASGTVSPPPQPAAQGYTPPKITAPVRPGSGPVRPQPEPVHVAPVHSAVAPVQSQAPRPSAGMGLSDPAQVWEAVLKELQDQGKRSVQACVSQGRLADLADGQAVVQFASAFAKERTEKEDYRQLIEKIFLQVVGHPVRLVCTIGHAKPAPAAQEKPAPAAPEQGTHPALSAAMKMFGNNVTKE